MHRIICMLLSLALLIGSFSANVTSAGAYELEDDYSEDIYFDNGFLPGDIDTSGEVNLTDIVVLAQYVAEWEVDCCVAALDPNGDTYCDLNDIVHLARYVAEWDEIELSSEKYTPDDEDYGDDDTYYTENLRVYNSEAPITEQYRGMSGSIYHAYGYMDDDRYGRKYTDAQRKIELDRLDDLGIRFARAMYSSNWVWDNTINAYNWDAERITSFWDYCKALQSRNINVVLQAGWHLGGFTQLDNYSISETFYIRDLTHKNGAGDLYGETVGYDFSQCKNNAYELMARRSLRMGENLAQLILQAKARGINNISHFSYFVEPSYPTTITNNMPDQTHPAYGYEGGSADEYIFVVQTIQQKLKERGVYDLVKHVGPNQCVNHGAGLLNYMLQRGLVDMFDVWTSHFYPSAYSLDSTYYFDIVDPAYEGYTQTLKNANAFGKVEFWLDEFNVRSNGLKIGEDNAWNGIQSVVCAIAAQQRGIDNIILCAIFDQLWIDQKNTGGEFKNGIHVCGSAPSLFVSDIPKKQYYNMGLFTKYNGYKNGKVYRTNNEDLSWYGDIQVGAVQLEDGSWTITVVNLYLEPYKINVNFDKAINQTLYKHSQAANDITPTSAAELAKTEKVFKKVQTNFTDVVAPHSVTVYTGCEF